MTPATSPVLDSSPASQPPGSPSASTPASTTGFLGDTTVDELLAEAATLDGRVVAVSGSFVADEGSAQLCSDMVVAPESEQRCDGRIGLTGTIPAETLATFDTTRPPLRKLWYGYVTVIGTFRASGPAGEPIIEIDRIFLAG